MVPRRWAASFMLAATSSHPSLLTAQHPLSAGGGAAASTSAVRTLTLILWSPARDPASGCAVGQPASPYGEGEIGGQSYVSVLAPSLASLRPWIRRR